VLINVGRRGLSRKLLAPQYGDDGRGDVNNSRSLGRRDVRLLHDAMVINYHAASPAFGKEHILIQLLDPDGAWSVNHARKDGISGYDFLHTSKIIWTSS
jgi:hypothetical protein